MYRFDVSKLTAREILDYNAANQSGDVEKTAVFLAQTCIECPPEMGDKPDAAAFADMEYGAFVEASAAFQESTEAAATAAGTGEFAIEANFRQIKAKDVGNRLLKPMAQGDIAGVVKFLVEVVTDCPKAWGKPNQTDTYMKLPYYTTFLPLMRQIGIEARTPKKLLNG